MSGSKNLKLAALMFFSLSFGVLHASFAQPAYGQTLKTLKSQWPRSARGITLSARIDVSDYFNYKYSDRASSYYSFKITQGYEDVYGYCRRSADFCSALRSKIIESGPSAQTVTISSNSGHGDSQIWTLVSWGKFSKASAIQGEKTNIVCSNFIIVGTKKECI